MITLGAFFSLLAYGELSNLAVVDPATPGTILASSQPKLVNYLNDALMRLYSRFVLKESDLLLMLSEERTFYHLLPKFSISYKPAGVSDNEPVRYIVDSVEEPFKDDVLRVMTVYNSFGLQLPLNNETNQSSVFTPQPKMLQVPRPDCQGWLNVRYQQRHIPIQGDLSEEIYCPDVLLTALTSYVAAKVYSHMDSQSSTMKAQEFFGTYESICTEVVDRDLVGSSISQSNTRFHRGGWV